MAFWDLRHPPHAVALVDEGGGPRTYSTLAHAADDAAAVLERYPARETGFLLFDTTADAVALYLGALRGGAQVPLLLQPGINPALLQALVDTYTPAWVAGALDGPVCHGYQQDCRFGSIAIAGRSDVQRLPTLHPECGLLLSTSGSTGSPKLVRLSYAALASNAESIASYLALNADDRAITTLPLAYSFGMSLLNSHLAAGASVVLTPHSVLTREFWSTAATHGVSSLSGVPSTYEMFRRAGLDKQPLGRLRMLTQAGGRLSETLTRYFADLALRQGWAFYVMYGQTEAAPRISYVPPERLSEKVGSIGIAIPGGTLDIEPATGELVYRGPNVMMGYATSREDLAKPDECGGILHTGDLARRDDDGYYYLTGRLKRFVKLAGSRVSLDEVESALGAALGVAVACVGVDDRLSVVMPEVATHDDAWLRAFLRDQFDIHHGFVRLHRMASLPHLSNGKLDYRAIEAIGQC